MVRCGPVYYWGMDAAYFRAWRAGHPEYRARQNRVRAARRTRNGREDRAREYARHNAMREPVIRAPLPAMHTGHDLFDEARAIVGPRRTSLVSVYDPLYDDLLSEAVLALLEGRDAAVAVRRYGAAERRYGRVTAPLIEDRNAED